MSSKAQALVAREFYRMCDKGRKLPTLEDYVERDLQMAKYRTRIAKKKQAYFPWGLLNSKKAAANLCKEDHKRKDSELIKMLTEDDLTARLAKWKEKLGGQIPSRTDVLSESDKASLDKHTSH